MFTELLLFLPLGLLWYLSVVKWYVILGLLGILYWLPKPLIKVISMCFPSILFYKKKSPHVSLTFDDVPYGSEKEIIDLLDAHGMKGTFFLISGQINDTNKSTFINAIRNGHQISNHGITNSMHALKSPWLINKFNEIFSSTGGNLITYEKEIDFCENKINVLYSEAGVNREKYRFYRPGCGLFTSGMVKYLRTKNLTLALGSVYPNDPIMRFSKWNYYYLKWHLSPGDVVILHDRKWTPSMLKDLLREMKSRNLMSVTLNTLISS